MSSDDRRPQHDVPFRSAGAGHLVSKLCDACLQPKLMRGGRYFTRGPLRLWNCAACAAKKDAPCTTN